jgi:hypothetical protein
MTLPLQLQAQVWQALALDCEHWVRLQMHVIHCVKQLK